ncbi:hypothetical protein ACHAPE_007733 [Trichoderma viride]
MSGAIAPLAPTFRGHIATTLDGIILFEACLQGRIPHVPRRPHDRERQDLIASGNVFIYEEHASGIKRWTDGVSWSPSRILGNFLIYRELDKPFPPGEKKRALKKKKHSNGGINRPERSNSQGQHSAAFAAVSNSMGSAQASDPERSLVGSLIDSYPFKENGLIKKTISIHYQGVPHHLVSYYSLEDALNGSMNTPSTDIRFGDIRPRNELLMNQNFRNPLDETAIFAHEDRGLIPIPMANFYSMQPAVQDLSPHGVVMTQSMAVASMPSQQPMHAAYPSGLDYDFYPAQQQAAHPHQALSHLPDPNHHHHAARQQAQLLQHHYQYEPQQPHHQQPPQHPLQHQLQSQQSQAHHLGDHQREDYQREEYQRQEYQRQEYQRQFSVAEMQQPLQNQQHPSPPEQAEQEPQQPQPQPQQQPEQQPQQQQPPAGYAPAPGGGWTYDANGYYYG